jgi:hypothetical protein
MVGRASALPLAFGPALLKFEARLLLSAERKLDGRAEVLPHNMPP